MKILEIEAIVPGLLVVEPFKLFRANLKLNRHDCFAGDKHGIDPPTEPRDIELKMDPRALMRGVGKSCTEHRQLQPPRGKLLGDEREAMGAGQRRVDLFVARGEKLAHGRGVVGGIEARAHHAGEPTTPGGRSWFGGRLKKYGTHEHSWPWLAAPPRNPAVSQLFDDICRLVSQGRNVIGEHAWERLLERGSMEWQIIAGMAEARLVVERRHAPPNPIVEMRVPLPDGDDCKVVWSLLRRESVAKLVTTHLLGDEGFSEEG